MTNLERGLYCQSTSCKNLHEEIIPGSSFLLYTQSWKKKKSRKKKNTPRGVHHKLDKSSHHSPSPHFLWQAHLYIAMQACTTTSSLTKSCQSVQSTSINSQKQVLLWQNLVHTYCHGALHTENQDYTLNYTQCVRLHTVLYTGVCKDIYLFFEKYRSPRDQVCRNTRIVFFICLAQEWKYDAHNIIFRCHWLQKYKTGLY